jgi:cytochrome c oxidase subunit 2
MAQDGERLFNQLGCASCHAADNSGRGPSLVGIYDTEQRMKSGDLKLVDETFIRQAIVNPNSLALPNYAPIMPTFQGQVSEEQVLQLIAYVKSLAGEERTSNSK